MDQFDYVIVGAGSAGCALAGRLSEDPNLSVCLMEAGGSHNNPLVTTPFGLIALVPYGLKNWSFKTVPQKGLNGRRGYQPRGKVLGGSSSINAMIYIRGHREDYDAWAKAGNAGWGWADVLPYFKKAEHFEPGENAFHQQGGPLNVAPLTDPAPINDLFFQAAQSLQYPMNSDFNGAQQEGVGYYHVTQKDGERWSAMRAYIDPILDRPNLTVISKARAQKINFEGKRAVGVTYKHGGRVSRVAARREVILSAGAFQSPQLLLLSGVGPRAQLEPLGINMVHDLPGVGENLQDHIDYTFSYRSDRLDTVGFSLKGFALGFQEFFNYKKSRKGMLATNYAESGGFIYADRSARSPDIQLHFTRAVVDEHGRKLHWGHGYSCHVCVLRPHSRGRVTLKDANPMSDPLIDPAFFSDERDFELLVKACKQVREIMESPAFDDVKGKPYYNCDTEDDAELRANIRQYADTIYHPVGTCKMGTDPMAVVNPLLQVHGLERLRVVDASIMPNLISGNTNAPSIMIGEKAADLIKDDAAALS